MPVLVICAIVALGASLTSKFVPHEGGYWRVILRIPSIVASTGFVTLAVYILLRHRVCLPASVPQSWTAKAQEREKPALRAVGFPGIIPSCDLPGGELVRRTGGQAVKPRNLDVVFSWAATATPNHKRSMSDGSRH